MSSRRTHDHEHNHARGHPHGAAGSGRAADGSAAVTKTDDPVDHGRYRYTFKVQGLDCAEEVAALRRAVGPLVGGEGRLAFDVLNGRMMVLGDADRVSVDAVRQAVRRTGMQAVEWRSEDQADPRADDRHRRIQAWLATLSGLSVLAGFALHVWLAGGFREALTLLAGHAGQSTPIPEMIAYGLAIAFGARYVVVKAWYAAAALRPDIHLLMVIAVTGACLMVERPKFERLKGFDERLALTHNDLDFCLRAREAGLSSVVTPHALLYHHERVTRRMMPEDADTTLFRERWRALYQEGDPYHNANLAKDRDDYAIAVPSVSKS